MTKSITIKNAEITDKQYLDNLAITSGKSVALALSSVVNIAKTYEQTAETLQKTIEENSKLKEKTDVLDSYVEQLLEEIELWKNKEPQTIEKTIEKTIEVEKKLTGSQFICELDEQTAYNARLVRKFAVKDGFVIFEKDVDYPGELAKVAIKQFINRHYIDLID